MDRLDSMPEPVKIPYALKRVPRQALATVRRCVGSPEPGSLLLARVDRVGADTAIELTDGRRSELHEGDRIAVVLGNRYAEAQFEGYAELDGDRVDLLGPGGVCGIVRSRHSSQGVPTRLKIIGAIRDRLGHVLKLSDFGIQKYQPASLSIPRIVVVCGSSMRSGKTYAAMNLIRGLLRSSPRVAGIKLTGAADGRDSFRWIDAGAALALDFVDCGCASTYLSSLDELLAIRDVLFAQVRSAGMEWVIVELADGLLQRETAELLQSPRFRRDVSAWLLAAADPLAAVASATLLKGWGIEPAAVTGLVTQSPLGVVEAQQMLDLPFVTASQLQSGTLATRIAEGSFRTPLEPLDASAGLERFLERA